MGYGATQRLKPWHRGEAIDRQHLSRMTFGDRSLEHEVLQLFDRQAELLIGRMRDGGDGAGGQDRRAGAYA